jgi:shikimate dehydrogenase
VTLPHKEAAARLAQRSSPAVLALGAANTLRFDAGGAVAENTDAPGLLAALDETDPEWRGRTGSALVLGAGGAAAAAVWALKQSGLERVLICNRTHERAVRLSDRLGAAVAPFESAADAFAEADLIINATSAGLQGDSAAVWSFASARPGALAMDMVYKPLATPFLRAAKARGLRTCDGLGMLVHQGALAFKAWFGVHPDTVAARARLMACLNETAL